ncbi:MAG: type VI secretion system tip protein TssI/VgrG [Pseudomonadota bacterium]
MPSSTVPPEFQNRPIFLRGSYKGGDKVALKDATVEQGLSRLTKTTAEIISFDKDLTTAAFLGEQIVVVHEDKEKKKEHVFSGTCISVENVGRYMGGLLFIAEIRPWLWFLKRIRDSRVYQDMTVIEIIKKVLEETGFTGRLLDETTGTYLKREYTIQYRESCYDFVCRLMEQEGVYYFFKQDGDAEKLVLADGQKGHNPTPDMPIYQFYYPDGSNRDQEHVSQWTEEDRVRTGKVSFREYDFEKSETIMEAVTQDKKGKHSHGLYEHYDYPGRFRITKPGANKSQDKELGRDRTKVREQSISVKAQISRGVANVRGMAAGQSFQLKGHEYVDRETEFIIMNATHYLGVEAEAKEDTATTSGALTQDDTQSNPLVKKRAKPGDISGSSGNAGNTVYRCSFDAFLKEVPYYAPQVTPWPAIPGIHTAKVVGPDNEEIYTDKYGRVKIQFHWDRQGNKDENSSCFVRVVMPWTGTEWGMISIPRIGNEVVVQFEEGDPDRPMITGMVYNDKNMPPYTLPDRKTETGIVTRSTLNGKKDTFHELIFDDKIKKELVRFQSERDYKQTIKNNAEITIGLEHTDNGDLTQTIHRNKTETLNTGDHTFTVKEGNETVFIKKNHKETIEGKSDEIITGNATQEVKQGNKTTTVKMGNITRKANMGKITEQAMQSIEFKVGANSIKIDQSGITIKGMMVKIEGTAMLNAKAPMTNVKGDGMLILSGGLTKIN